jgi:hypothetical protein
MTDTVDDFTKEADPMRETLRLPMCAVRADDGSIAAADVVKHQRLNEAAV